MLCYKTAVVLAYCSKLDVGDKCIFILKLPQVLSKEKNVWLQASFSFLKPILLPLLNPSSHHICTLPVGNSCAIL